MSSESQYAGASYILTGSYDERLDEAQRRRDKGELDEALAIAQRILDRILRLPERRREPGSELFEYHIRAAALLADVHHALGDAAAAEALWRQLAVWDQDNSLYWRREIGRRQVDRGDVEQGLQELWALTEAFPDVVDNWLAVATSAMDAGQYTLAEAYLDKAQPLISQIGDDEDIAGVLALGALTALETAHWQKAVEIWFHAIDLDPSLASLSERVLRKLLLAKQYDLAHEMLDEDIMPKPAIQYYQAWIAWRKGDQLRARYLWRQVADRDHDDDENRLVCVRALALCWLGRSLEAVTVLLQVASEEQFLRDSIAAALALAWAILGKLDQAHADLMLATRRGKRVHLLSPLEWYDFDSLITDEEIKASLREFFDLESPQPPGEP